MTQHDYLKNMVNAIIDNDAGRELNERQLSKHPNDQKTRKQYFANKLGRLSQGTGVRVEVKNTMFFIAKYQVPRDLLKDI